jgi:hypothetical protein
MPKTSDAPNPGASAAKALKQTSATNQTSTNLSRMPKPKESQ